MSCGLIQKRQTATTATTARAFVETAADESVWSAVVTAVSLTYEYCTVLSVVGTTSVRKNGEASASSVYFQQPCTISENLDTSY